MDVYEILSEQDFPYNYWCAEVYDMNKVSVRSINLESTEELRKEGKAFVISSENYAGSCREVTDITFDKLPSYEEFIKIVKDGIDGKLNYVSSEKIVYSDYNFSFGVDETDEEDESEADDSESEDDEEPMFSDGEFTIER